MNQLSSEIGAAKDVEEKMGLYEKILMECQDAIQIIRDEINQESVSYFSKFASSCPK